MSTRSALLSTQQARIMQRCKCRRYDVGIETNMEFKRPLSVFLNELQRRSAIHISKRGENCPSECVYVGISIQFGGKALSALKKPRIFSRRMHRTDDDDAIERGKREGNFKTLSHDEVFYVRIGGGTATSRRCPYPYSASIQPIISCAPLTYHC